MEIHWYENQEDGSTHLFVTDGELPLVGTKIYFNDFRTGVKRARFTVKDANTSITMSSAPIGSIPIPREITDGMDRYVFACKYIREERGGAPSDLNTERRAIEFVTQVGEVTLERIKDE
jgi:hypothetical protein